MDDVRAYAQTLSASPGVYRMYSADGQLLYVGKAKNLRKRVESYFTRAHDARLASMVSQIARIEVMLTRTEAEALLLEAQLIKNLHPRYNLDLKDDKSYPYIHLTADPEFPWPRFYRGSKSVAGKFFGPYPSAAAVRDTLDTVFKTFLLRSCEDSVFKHRSRPCLQHQIKRCSAPCVGLISKQDYQQSLRHAELFLKGGSNQVVEELIASMDEAARALHFERAAEIRDRIAQIKRIQAKHYTSEGSTDLDVVAIAVESGMACASVVMFRDGRNLGSRSLCFKLPLDASLDQTRAQFLLQYYQASEHPSEILVALDDSEEWREPLSEALSTQAAKPLRLVPNPRGERLKWLELAQRTAEQHLHSELSHAATLKQRFAALNALLKVETPIARIECFDISHTMGEATVASCVVFDESGPVKSDYRRFNLANVSDGNDYLAMRTALERRFSRLKSGEGKAPDLLLIDGGQGQLKQAFEVLDALGLSEIRALGVAKGPERKAGHETLVLGREFKSIFPGPESLASHLIQQVRDEAHRFAITGHRARRGKARTRSSLEEISGIGPKRRSALLKAFGGLQGIHKAGVDELMQVGGVNRELAERIYAALHAG
jgi:excinuclease ABC subunit C